MSRYAQTLKSTISTFDASLQLHMPVSPYRDFQLWALQSPHKETWWQILGLPQFAKLTITLLNDLVSDTQWQQVMDYADVMNTYLIYETVSDNFAIHLQSRPLDDDLRKLQLETLYTFNNTIMTRLESDTVSTTELLAATRSMTERLSCFTHSLTSNEQRVFANQFLSEYNDASLADLEFGGWGALVANVETCVDVSRKLSGNLLGNLLQKGLYQRYQAVNRLLVEHDMPIAELVEVSAYAILVIPVLTYYISVLNELISPTPQLATLVSNGALEKTLYKSAILVRLLNDVGTQLLVNENYHQLLESALEQKLNRNLTINAALSELAPEMPFLTRLQKDITYGEYNVCLYNINNRPCTPETIATLRDNLAYFSRIYRETRLQMVRELEAITQVLDTDVPSRLILRFVEFHEYVYNHPFDSQAGDYATKPVYASAS